jgi:hypothetical protein
MIHPKMTIIAFFLAVLQLEDSPIRKGAIDARALLLPEIRRRGIVREGG